MDHHFFLLFFSFMCIDLGSVPHQIEWFWEIWNRQALFTFLNFVLLVWRRLKTKMQYYNVFFFQCMGLICSYTFESENLLITINGIYALLGECIASKITHLVGCSNNTYCDSGMNFLFSYFLSFFLAFFLFRFHFGLFLSEGIKGAFVFSLRSVRVRKHDSRFVDSMVVCDGYCYCFRPNVHTL